MQQHRQPAPTALIISALGVVFGDIGTSPLYTLRECFTSTGLALTPINIFGILSCIAWSLILVVTIKYVAIIMRADNRGEGGILALTALAMDQFATRRQFARVLFLGLLGTALFYGDSLITPAISVLSAVEGLHLITPAFQPYIIPITLTLLIALFAMQSYGTEKVGNCFGPIMLVWFTALALMGGKQIAEHPDILLALNPIHAYTFAQANPALAFIALSAVVLAVTGAEALYADMGHFGRQPIQYAWLLMVGPSLILNYFGQGALLLSNPDAIANPFYMMVPEGLMVPMVILATAATIIASQAVISGAFSLTQQAIQLGYMPRLEIRHTNIHATGQIYIPAINYMLLSGVILLVLGFQTSSNLAAAYGIAVVGTMLISTLLATTVLTSRNRWHPLAAGVFAGTFIAVDGMFFTASLHKISDGGWFPLTLGFLIVFLMHTWVKGRDASQQIVLSQTPPLDHFLMHLDPTLPHVRRTAVFLTSDINHAPPAFVYNLAHNAMLHAQIIILKISRARIPRYPASERISIRHHPHNVTTVQASFGFMERPNIPHLLTELPRHGLQIRHPDALSYFISSHTYVASPNRALNRWQEPVFIFMDKIAQSAIAFFHLPREQVIEIGNQIEI